MVYIIEIFIVILNSLSFNLISVQGSVKINSACVTKWDCGENAVCGDDKICSCPAGFTSINEIDCSKSIDLRLTNFKWYEFDDNDFKLRLK